MTIAFRDMWRSKLRFALLAGAVGLLFFLLLFLNTLSATLLGQFVGAVESGSSDVVVFSSGAQATIPASRLEASSVDAIASVPGVDRAAAISELTVSSEVAGVITDVSLWGIEVGGPGTPVDIVEGRLPGPGEVVIDRTAANNSGFSMGTRFQAGDTELTVVGVADNATYAVVPTAYLPMETWTEVFRSEYPQSPVTPFNVVGVQVASGADAAAVASAINSSVPGVEALTRQAAADATPGVSSISQSFGLIVGITFLIVIVVVGFFFQILTVQKLRAFTVLKAVGATTAKLARAVSAQIVAMVVAGVLVGTGLLAVTAAGTKDVFAISLDPALITQAGAAVLAFSLLVGLFSIRRIARQDPASAAAGGGR